MADASSVQDTRRGVEQEESDSGASEYAHLRSKRAQREGNVEEAFVEDVFVGPDLVTLSVSFEWSSGTERFKYDLDDDRDVLKLETLTEAVGFEFEQVSHLEGTTIEVVYTGHEWVPQAHASFVEGEGSPMETFRTELRLLGREIARSPRFLRRAVRGLRTASTRGAIVGIILTKKLLVVALILYLIL